MSDEQYRKLGLDIAGLHGKVVGMVTVLSLGVGIVLGLAISTHKMVSEIHAKAATTQVQP